METLFSLKDYRATHFLMSFIRSQVQGWYTRENILAKAKHPAGKEDKLALLVQLIEKVNGWNDAIKPEDPPFLRTDGTVTNPELVKEVCGILQSLFGQFAGMNDRLVAILDNPEPLHYRKQDFQYIIACMGWVYYAINHAVHGDNHFAQRFGDQELLETRKGDAELSQREVDFVNYFFYEFKNEATYHPETCKNITAMIEVVLNETMKNFATQIDRYLTLFGQ